MGWDGRFIQQVQPPASATPVHEGETSCVNLEVPTVVFISHFSRKKEKNVKVAPEKRKKCF